MSILKFSLPRMDKGIENVLTVFCWFSDMLANNVVDELRRYCKWNCFSDEKSTNIGVGHFKICCALCRTFDLNCKIICFQSVMWFQLAAIKLSFICLNFQYWSISSLWIYTTGGVQILLDAFSWSIFLLFVFIKFLACNELLIFIENDASFCFCKWILINKLSGFMDAFRMIFEKSKRTS